MNNHRHLSSEEIFEQISEGLSAQGVSGCEACEAEAASWSRFCGELRRADAEMAATTEWDDLLLRRRIREALANEKPHVRSIFDRFFVLRPAFVSALAGMIVLALWTSFSGVPSQPVKVAVLSAGAPGRLPVWNPLPEESEDEGLAVLAEWTPTEDEIVIARCRAACLAGLSSHEEENLLSAVTLNSARSPLTGASPL
jgi:hypothetical protein